MILVEWILGNSCKNCVFLRFCILEWNNFILLNSLFNSKYEPCMVVVWSFFQSYLFYNWNMYGCNGRRIKSGWKRQLFSKTQFLPVFARNLDFAFHEIYWTFGVKNGLIWFCLSNKVRMKKNCVKLRLSDSNREIIKVLEKVCKELFL